jgi:hypothetical protein
MVWHRFVTSKIETSGISYEHGDEFSFIHSFILQPFVGLWPLLQFRNILYTDVRTPWTGDQPVIRPLPTHTHITNTE